MRAEQADEEKVEREVHAVVDETQRLCGQREQRDR
jgi:hypothetical protein